jgi:thiamine pyrophosphokinase
MYGVVFTGGAGPDVEQCRQLIAGADLIIAADSGLIAAEAAGAEVDWIVGDMDSLDDERRLEKYPCEKIIRYNTDKDYTDTELALRLLWDKGCTETTLIGGGGGRVDHLFALRSLFEREPSPDCWITNNEALYRLSADRFTMYKQFNLKPESLVSVFPLGDGPWHINSWGLKWPLDDLIWSRGFAGISNIALNGLFSLSARAGSFLIIIGS